MRPRLFTVRNILLFLVAAGLLGGLATWYSRGMPLPGSEVPSTANQLAFVSDRGGKPDLYMIDADGNGEPARLTDDDAAERAPAWSPGGGQIAFISEGRGGDLNPQLFEMKAAPGRPIAKVTTTDSPKESPVFGGDQRLYYLDAGKVASVGTDGANSLAVLPDPDQRANHRDLFGAGGFVQAAPNTDASRVTAVMHTEDGDALVLYDPTEEVEALYLIGLADRIRFSHAKDGGFVAVFVGSQPFPQPLPLFSHETESGQLPPDQMGILANIRNLIINPSSVEGNLRPPRDPDLRFVARFDKDGKVSSGFALPDFSPDAIFASPDGSKLLLTAEEKGGILLVEPDQQRVGKLWDQPARDATWSPDGTRFAFVSGPDIYIAPADGSAPPKNLTNGKGQNYAPAWSPAVAKK